MIFGEGQKCLYLVNGRWVPCVLEQRDGNRYYISWNMGKCGGFANELELKPIHIQDLLLEKPREFSEEMPSHMTFERMLSEMKHFPITFMNSEGCDNGD